MTPAQSAQVSRLLVAREFGWTLEAVDSLSLPDFYDALALCGAWRALAQGRQA